MSSTTSVSVLCAAAHRDKTCLRAYEAPEVAAGATRRGPGCPTARPISQPQPYPRPRSGTANVGRRLAGGRGGHRHQGARTLLRRRSQIRAQTIAVRRMAFASDALRGLEGLETCASVVRRGGRSAVRDTCTR
ncbi:hypothetical protein C8T65DRAFT_662667, partial [Cerioporus squamosus]